MQETLVQFLDREDLLEKGTATHASILAWRSQTLLSDFHFHFFCYANMYWPLSLTNHLMPIISHVDQRVSQREPNISRHGFSLILRELFLKLDISANKPTLNLPGTQLLLGRLAPLVRNWSEWGQPFEAYFSRTKIPKRETNKKLVTPKIAPITNTCL